MILRNWKKTKIKVDGKLGSHAWSFMTEDLKVMRRNFLNDGRSLSNKE